MESILKQHYPKLQQEMQQQAYKLAVLQFRKIRDLINQQLPEDL